MARRGYYTSVSRTKRSASYTVAIVLGVILALLVGFIVWAVVVFGNGSEGAFKSQAQQISELKIQLNEKDAIIAQLTEELESYRGKGMQQFDAPIGPVAATPSPTPKPTPIVTARPTSAPLAPPVLPAPTDSPTESPITPTDAPTPPPTTVQNGASPAAGQGPEQTAVPAAVGTGV